MPAVPALPAGPAVLAIDIGAEAAELLLLADGGEERAAVRTGGAGTAAGILEHLDAFAARPGVVVLAFEAGQVDEAPIALVVTEGADGGALLVPAELRFELHGHLRADGSVEVAPDHSEVRNIVREAEEAGAEAIAVALRHSSANPTFEELFDQVAAASGLVVALASDVAGDTGDERERVRRTVEAAHAGVAARRLIEPLLRAFHERGIADVRVVRRDGSLVAAEQALRDPSPTSGTTRHTAAEAARRLAGV